MIRTCRECNTDFETTNDRAEFCCANHRFAWNNRRGTRGSELYDLFMATRYERELAKKLGLMAVMYKLAQAWRQDDVANRRKSYTDPTTALQRAAKTVKQQVASEAP